MTLTPGMLIHGRRRDAGATVDTLSRATHDGLTDQGRRFRLRQSRLPRDENGDVVDDGGEVEPVDPVGEPVTDFHLTPSSGGNAFVLAVRGDHVDAMVHYPHGQRLERNIPVVNPADSSDADVFATSDAVEAKNPVVEPPVRVDPPDIIPPDIVEPPVVDPPDLG